MISSIPVFDADSHIAEVPDLWTSRLPMSKWGDDVPHVVFDERLKRDRWVIGGRMLTSVANWAVAGWQRVPARAPADRRRCRPGRLRARASAASGWMSTASTARRCTRTCLRSPITRSWRSRTPSCRSSASRPTTTTWWISPSVDPKRFVLLAALPFWNVEESVKEIERCARDRPPRASCSSPSRTRSGLPRISDEHWTPIFDATQDKGWSVNFHTGFADFSEDGIQVDAQQARRPARLRPAVGVRPT